MTHSVTAPPMATHANPTPASMAGRYVMLLGEPFYCIAHYNAIEPFFISITSSADHWLFIATTGGLTAGRKSADVALFPYYTVDRVTENAENTGAKTLIQVTEGGQQRLWEPFSERYRGLYPIQRNLYKNIPGTVLLFEEINPAFGLTYRYAWATSPTFGFVKSAWLSNHSDQPRTVQVVDGLQNILPAKVNANLQSRFSVLLDAYKRTELVAETGLGLFTLSSQLTDLAEPSEALRANVVWQVGLRDVVHLLSSQQLDAIRDGQLPQPETDIRGRRGAYLVASQLTLAAGQEQMWQIVAEVGLDSASVVALNQRLQTDRKALAAQVQADIRENTRQLTEIIAQADGLQHSNDAMSTAHHFANVMFNVMRGGAFVDGYQINPADLQAYVATHHRPTAQKQAAFFAALPASVTVTELRARAAATHDRDLMRLCSTYLPLTFSRRHGDPSRPWNQFAINLYNPDGTRRFDYQGNWRDIFQNWEALAYSYPHYLEGMIGVFLNATTVDGYNPYRVTRDGIEWEAPDPNDPWANIGYWSDHQIIYLLKLLEAVEHFFPDTLPQLLTRGQYTYADVPYRIKRYDDLCRAPTASIEFDWARHEEIATRVAEVGSDGRCVMDAHGQLVYSTLAEKLLNLLLAKMVNFVPEGGIWMNTQRPEWNDANNALAGNGLSVVTLGYLLRYVRFFQRLLARASGPTVALSTELADLLAAIGQGLQQFRPQLDATFDPDTRKQLMDILGQAGSDFRWGYYQQGLAGQQREVPVGDLSEFLALVADYIGHSLRANRRDDDLYHAYNVLQLNGQQAQFHHLDLMLEGQVAILSSGLLTPAEALRLLQHLRHSPLYRADQHSYILYPDRRLPGFLEKNIVSPSDVAQIGLLAALAEAADLRLIIRDVNGDFHFNGDFRNAEDVHRVLAELARDSRYADRALADGEAVLKLFEATFHHSAFTGRSGSFFAYEGLGSIYWHMVSKLLLAIQEVIFSTATTPTSADSLPGLIAAYEDVRAGLGFNKTPAVYGAFPTDPYSHTPAGRGAKQPGMTGMVKEEILTRLGELGLTIGNATLTFNPLLVRGVELQSAPATLEYYDVAGQPQTLELPAGSFGYTFCQTPIVVRHGTNPSIEIMFANGAVQTVAGSQLPADVSRRIFDRDGAVRALMVRLPLLGV